MLQYSNATLNLCDHLQPNSRLWQQGTGMQGLAGLNTGSFGMPAIMLAMPGVRPSAYGIILMAERQASTGGIGGFDPRMDKVSGVQPKTYKTQISTDRLLGDFNKLNTGSHSRQDGWPPGWASGSAKPGGGPTTS